MTDTMYRGAYRLQGIYQGSVIEEGQPRTDRQHVRRAVHRVDHPPETLVAEREHRVDPQHVRAVQRHVPPHRPAVQGRVEHLVGLQVDAGAPALEVDRGTTPDPRCGRVQAPGQVVGQHDDHPRSPS